MNRRNQDKSRSIINIYPGLMAIIRFGWQHWQQSYFLVTIWTCAVIPFLRLHLYDGNENDDDDVVYVAAHTDDDDADVAADTAHEDGIQLDPNWTNLF